MPTLLLSKLNEQELRMVFLHEMAHVRRNDTVLNWLMIGVQFLHWFNPLVWMAFRRLRADRELVCDSMVMARVHPEDHVGYGVVLLKLVEKFSESPRLISIALP
ncbi:MAG TPA: M56 family metallopeptidase, partial [Verrucomicrobiae bacterium]